MNAATPSTSRTASTVLAFLAGIAAVATLLVPTGELPMVWDEGDALVRADAIADWFRRIDVRDLPNSLTQAARPATIRDGWPFTMSREGHPPAYAVTIVAGAALAPEGLAPLSASRLGPKLLFAFAVACVAYRLSRSHGPIAALTAAAALITSPRLIAHAGYASFDGPLTSAWLIAWAAYGPTHRPLSATWWGLALGATCAMKFTGLLAVPAFLTAWLVVRDRRFLYLILGLAAALTTYYILNPPLWHEPVAGFYEHLRLNLNRQQLPGLNIAVRFLGHYYDLDHPLPWYNTSVWLLIVVPLPWLVLGAIGALSALRRTRQDSSSAALLFSWLIPMIVRALPVAPPHDGIRLFLPAFAFFAVLTGYGADALLAFAKKRSTDRRRRLASASIYVTLVACTAAAFTSSYRYGPQRLSYYNVLIGGLSGATAAGMEPTYYWDALDQSVLDWLHEHTRPEDRLRFAAAPRDNLRYLVEQGHLKRTVSLADHPRDRWYIIQNRPSAHAPVDRWLIAHATPAFTNRIRATGWDAAFLDVPLLYVFSVEDYRHAIQAIAAEESTNPSL